MAVPGLMLNYRLDVPPMVDFDRKRATTRLTIRATASNPSESDDYVLHCTAPTFWHLLDENQKEVQRDAVAAKASSAPPVRTETVAAGHSAHEVIRLNLDNRRLVAGKTYTIRCMVWGQSAEASFVPVEKPSPGRAKKGSARKARPKKRSARKKPAKKKATKKRVTKKPAKKRAAKKRVVKKPAKKKATKKRIGKKPAKKKATKKRAVKKPARKKVAKKSAARKTTKKRA